MLSYEVLYIIILHFIHKIYIYIYYMAPPKDKFLAPPLIHKLFYLNLSHTNTHVCNPKIPLKSLNH